MKTIVLMYHDIYVREPSESGFQNPTAIKYKISLENFEKQVQAINDFLKQNGLPKSYVEFTFDDGGVSFINIAAPILEKYGFHGLFFISTKYIGTNGFLNVDQIKELHSRGHIIGPHSHSHPERMSSLSSDEIQFEWQYSQNILSDILQTRPSVASIPNGYSSKTVIDAMANAGIRYIYTSVPTTKHKKSGDSIIIGRYVVTAGDSLDGIMSLLSSSLTRTIHYTKFECLGIAKFILGDAYLKLRNYLIK